MQMQCKAILVVTFTFDKFKFTLKQKNYLAIGWNKTTRSLWMENCFMSNEEYLKTKQRDEVQYLLILA